MGNLDLAARRLEVALKQYPEEPLIISLQGMLHARRHESGPALQVCAQFPGLRGLLHPHPPWAPPRMPPGQHFIEDDAEREQVAALVDALSLDLFGGHVGDGAQHLARSAEIQRRHGLRFQQTGARMIFQRTATTPSSIFSMAVYTVLFTTLAALGELALLAYLARGLAQARRRRRKGRASSDAPLTCEHDVGQARPP